jgi:hypothetical protein
VWVILSGSGMLLPGLRQLASSPGTRSTRCEPKWTPCPPTCFHAVSPPAPPQLVGWMAHQTVARGKWRNARRRRRRGGVPLAHSRRSSMQAKFLPETSCGIRAHRHAPPPSARLCFAHRSNCGNLELHCTADHAHCL